MRIALWVHCFYPEHFYGTETYTLHLARNLLDLGHEVTVVSAVFPGETKREQILTRSMYEGVPVITIDKNFFLHTRVKDTYYQPELRELHGSILAELKPDLVHVTHLINHTGVLLEETAKLKIPTIATFTDFFGFCFNNKLQGADDGPCPGPNSRRTNCVACYIRARSSQWPEARVAELSKKYPASRVLAEAANFARHIPGFRKGHLAGTILDISHRPDILAACYRNYAAAIAPTKFLETAYARSGCAVPLYNIRFGTDLPRVPKPLGSGPLQFGYIGQLARHKGVDLLIAAFKQLPAGSAVLRIYGPEQQDPAYSAELRATAQDSQIFFHGTFPNAKMPEVLAPLDFLVIPSRWHENSPLVLLDSLASRTPVIVSDVDGLTEFVESEVNGYSFARGDAGALGSLLRRLIQDPAAARKLRLATEYERTTRSMTLDVVKLYEQVLGNNRMAARN